MASYKVVIKKSAQKEIRKLPSARLRERIVAKITQLKNNPRPSGSEKLKGSKSSYRIRIGNHRVIYTIFNKKLVVYVFKVAHRRKVYRSF